jgi:hypothetical protein
MTVEKVVAMQKHFYCNWDDNIYQQVIGYFDVDPKQKSIRIIPWGKSWV